MKQIELIAILSLIAIFLIGMIILKPNPVVKEKEMVSVSVCNSTERAAHTKGFFAGYIYLYSQPELINTNTLELTVPLEAEMESWIDWKGP